MARLSHIYIEDYKRGISKELDYTGDGKPMYAFWLTPEQAKSACIIERKETIEEVCEWLENNLLRYWGQMNANKTEDFIKDFKDYMKG